MKNLIYILILLSFTSCKTKKINTINPTGTYELGNFNPDSEKETTGYFGLIQVKRFAKNKIVMTFMINKGAPSFNSGSFVDTLEYKSDRAIYKKAEYDPSCEITFDFSAKGVTVKEKTDDYNSGCGFGHAVVANGFYRKTSFKEPILREPLTDELIEK